MAKKVSSPQKFAQQNYKVISGWGKVYCSDLIHYNGKPFSFNKIVHDYEHEIATTQKISFKNREFHFAIYKYTRYEYFNKSIKESNGSYDVSLTFVSPLKWNDPCESVFYQPNIQIGGKIYDVKCICTTLEPTEGEEAAWNRTEKSGDMNEKTIRLAYGFMPFCELLHIMCEKEDGLSFYLSMADYSESRKYFNSKPAPYSTIEDYIRVLSKKRKAFAYENEMRIFAVREVQQQEITNDNGLLTLKATIGADKIKNLLLNVTLPPLKPVSSEKLKRLTYGNRQDIDNFDLRIDLLNLCGSKIFQNKDIRQCHLYEIAGNSKYASSLVSQYRKTP